LGVEIVSGIDQLKRREFIAFLGWWRGHWRHARSSK
jgi:hypothetical protein